MRMLAPESVARAEALWAVAVDHQILAIRALTFARRFLDAGDSARTVAYIERSDRHSKLSSQMESGSLDVFGTAVEEAKWRAVYESGRIALGFATISANGLLVPALGPTWGPIAAVGVDLAKDSFLLTTDYLLDVATGDPETAKQKAIIDAMVMVVMKTTGIERFVGREWTRSWGHSGAFFISKYLDSTDFQNEVVQGAMSIAGNVGEESVKGTVQSVVARVLNPNLATR
jgi:hypothetical protein